MTRKRLTLLLTFLMLVLLCSGLAGIVRAVMTGGMPMEDGATLADGKVVAVVDDIVVAYILDAGDGGVVLVDTGQDPQAQALLAAMAAQGHTPADVRAILLTHGHGDHMGGVPAFPQAPVYVLQPDADLTRGERVADSLLGRLKSAEPTGILVARELQDGEQFTIGALSVEVFAIPGHTRGSAAYLAHGVLFVGDSAASTKDGQLAGAPPVFSADREQNRASLRQLAQRLQPRSAEIMAIAPGHQGALTGADALMAWLED